MSANGPVRGTATPATMAATFETGVGVALRQDHHDSLRTPRLSILRFHGRDTDLELVGKSTPIAAATLSRSGEHTRPSVVRMACVGSECQLNPSTFKPGIVEYVSIPFY